MTKTDKRICSSFLVHVLRFFCYGKLLWQIYRARCLLRALPQHCCHQVLDFKCSCKHDNHEFVTANSCKHDNHEMLDKICQCPALDEKQVAMLGDVTRELENLRINEKKLTRIEHFSQKM